MKNTAILSDLQLINTLTHQLIAHQFVLKIVKNFNSSLISSSRGLKPNMHPRGGQKGGKGKPSFNSNTPHTGNLCNKSGHLSHSCPYAKEFQQVLAERENLNSIDYLPKRRKEDEDNDEYGMMITATENVTHVEHALSVHLGILDSGCSSHTVKEESLPVDAVMDRRKSATINTAQNGASMHSHGRSSNGLLQNALVVEGNQLSKNLVSIPKLDRMGLTITFRGGKGVVTDAAGNIISTVPLSDND